MSGLLFDSFRQQCHRQTARRIEVVTPLGSALNLIRNIFDVVQEINQSSVLVVDWDMIGFQWRSIKSPAAFRISLRWTAMACGFPNVRHGLGRGVEVDYRVGEWTLRIIRKDVDLPRIPPLVRVASEKVPVNDVAGLLAYAKAQSKPMLYASAGPTRSGI